MILKPKNREEWLVMRRNQGIGSSDAGCVIGLNPWKTNIDIYRELIGEKQAADISDNPSVILGKKAEEHIRKLFILDYPHFTVNYHEFWMQTEKKERRYMILLNGMIQR